jgi:hypothetical protein
MTPTPAVLPATGGAAGSDGRGAMAMIAALAAAGVAAAATLLAHRKYEGHT